MMNLSLYTELRKEYIKTWRIWYAMNQRCDPVWRKKYGNCGSKCVFEIVDEWSREEFGEEGFINFFKKYLSTSLIVWETLNTFQTYIARTQPNHMDQRTGSREIHTQEQSTAGIIPVTKPRQCVRQNSEAYQDGCFMPE